MKFTRNGNTIILTCDTGIGWTINLTNDRNCELNAEAVMRHLQAYADQQDKFAENRFDREKWAKLDAQREAARLKNSNAQLRGVIRRLRRAAQEKV